MVPIVTASPEPTALNLALLALSILQSNLPNAELINEFQITDLRSMAGHAGETVEVFQELLQEMLEKARTTKQADKIEPALSRPDLNDLLQRVVSIEPFSTPLETNKALRYALIETAVRGVFNEYLVSASPSLEDEPI
jgi:hypothetical protein